MDFKKVWPDIYYDEGQPDLPFKKCQSYEIDFSENHNFGDKKIYLKMFQCPFRKEGKPDPGIYFMALGSKSDEVYLFIDADSPHPQKEVVAWYWSEPFQGNQ